MFKRFIHLLRQALMPLAIFILIGFTIGFFITGFVVNNNFSYYEATINSKESPEEFFSVEALDSLTLKINSYNKKIENKEIEGKRAIKREDRKSVV